MIPPRLLPLARLVGGRVGIVLAMGAIAVLVVAFAVTLQRGRDEAVAKATHQINVVADALEMYTRELFHTNTLALEALADRIAAIPESGPESGIGSPANLQRLLRRMADTLGHDRNIMLVDAQGTLRATARDQLDGPVTVSDRGYFIHHVGNASLNIRVGEPLMPPLRDGSVVPVTRRLEDAKGQFAGVGLIGLPPTMFGPFHRTLDMGDGSHLMLLTDDGTILAREPQDAGLIGHQIPVRKVFAGLAEGRLRHSDMVISPLDGSPRIAAFRRLPDLGLIVLVGVNADDALAAWRADVQSGIALALPTFAVLVTVLVGMVAQNRIMQASEAVARASEERVRWITGALPGVVYQFRIDAAGEMSCPFISPQLEALYGLPPEAVYADARAMFRAIVQEDVPPLLTSIEASRASLTPWSQQWRLQRDDGIRHLRGQSVPHRQDDGSVVWDGIIVDVTELVEVHDALSAERALFVGGPVVVFKWRATTGWPVEYVSPNVESAWGYRASTLLAGRPGYSDLIDPDDRERVAQEVTDHVRDGRIYFEQEYRIRRADGQMRWMYDFTIVGRAADGTVSYFLGYLLDITERKEMEEQIGAERDFIRAVINSLPGVFYVIDPEGDFEMVNNTLARISGYSPAELREIGPLAIIAPPDRRAITTAIRRVFEQGDAETEANLLTRDGRELPYFFTGARFVGAQGPRLVGMGLDVAARRQMEEAIRKSNEELESFAYIASHDLQEPLRTITTFLQLLKREFGAGMAEDAITYIDFAVDGSLRMSHLIRDLLQYSRAGRSRVSGTHADLAEAYDGALALLGSAMAEAGAEVTATALPVVIGDVDQLTRLLQNLIGNALKYRHADRRPVIRVTAERDGESWRISVADNGIGIEAVYHQKIFQVFQRLHGRGEYEGTGIGLAICKKIVEAHGGTLTVDSIPGEGATFSFSLKAVDAPSPALSP